MILSYSRYQDHDLTIECTAGHDNGGNPSKEKKIESVRVWVWVQFRVRLKVHVGRLGFEANLYQYSAIVMITNNTSNHDYHIKY